MIALEGKGPYMKVHKGFDYGANIAKPRACMYHPRTVVRSEASFIVMVEQAFYCISSSD